MRLPRLSLSVVLTLVPAASLAVSFTILASSSLMRSQSLAHPWSVPDEPALLLTEPPSLWAFIPSMVG